MASKTKVEYVPARLSSNGKNYDVELRLTVKEMNLDGTVERAIAETELARSNADVPDGQYSLAYSFGGRQQKHSVRV
jgi:hypothetical protein